jgi:hypothetical protein
MRLCRPARGVVRPPGGSGRGLAGWNKSWNDGVEMTAAGRMQAGTIIYFWPSLGKEGEVLWPWQVRINLRPPFGGHSRFK